MSTRTNITTDKIFVFEKNKVSYEQNGELKKLVLQTPLMRTKFGFATEFGKNTVTKLEFFGINSKYKNPGVNTDEISEFYELILLIEKLVSEKLINYYKSYSEDEEIDIDDITINMKTNFYDKNKDYDPLFKVKLPNWNNEYKTIFKRKGKESSYYGIKKIINNNTLVKCKIEAGYIYNKRVDENNVNVSIIWELKEIDIQ
jgi:hypothetical protein